MHHHTELPFVDEFRWVSPFPYLKNGWQNAVLLWCMLQEWPPSLHYYCAVVLHSCTLLPPVGHSSNHQYHYCQLTRQSSCVSNFYRTFKVFIWLSLVYSFSDKLYPTWRWPQQHWPKHVVDKLYTPDNTVVLWLLYPYRIITLGSYDLRVPIAPEILQVPTAWSPEGLSMPMMG